MNKPRGGWKSMTVLCAVLTAISLSEACAQVSLPRTASAAARRVALVVGVGKYQYIPALDNPPNDARLIARTLEQLGFALVGGGPQIDVDKPAFDHVVQRFGEALVGAEVGLFFYAGHGLQVQGTNWLVPTGANPTRPQDLDFQMIDAGLILKQMDGAGTRLNLLILDACRNNPFGVRGLRGAESGLAQMRAPEGTLIAYATQPGNVALDGVGAQSPFSSALVRPGLDVFRLFNQVGLDVKRTTGGQQQPWVSNSPIEGDFYFASPDASISVAGQSVQPVPQMPLSVGPSLAIQPPSKEAVVIPMAPPSIGAVPRNPGAERANQEGEAAENRKDYGVALQWYRRAADAGSTAAQCNLGWLYQNGLGVPQDDAQALGWYRRAAEAGHAMAANNLGVMYKNGWGTERDYREAMRWYRHAADAGNVQAQSNIGVMYHNGLGVERDYVQAMQWYRHAAEAGDVAAQVNIGMLLKNGLGVEQDYGRAMQWLRRAADNGSAAAEFNIGMLYENGLGVPRDHTEAVKWLRKAATTGNPQARSMLAAFGE